jgi:hypothetical protein
VVLHAAVGLQTIVLTGGFMGRPKEELNRPALEKELDELGNQGFEHCWVLQSRRCRRRRMGTA